MAGHPTLPDPEDKRLSRVGRPDETFGRMDTVVSARIPNGRGGYLCPVPSSHAVHAIFHAARHVPGMPLGYNRCEARHMNNGEGDRDMEPEDLGEYTTLIVSIRQDDAGRLSGVVERVRTGSGSMASRP
jgi:hypothetical protein